MPCRRLAAISIVLLIAMGLIPSRADAQEFTQWGWPQPYERVSNQSVAWLKKKGWWPLNLAWVPAASGQNAAALTMSNRDLLGQRGVELKMRAYTAGVGVAEGLKSGRMQVGFIGNVPLNLLLDGKTPVAILATYAPNLRHSVVVPSNSALSRLADLKDARKPWVIGVAKNSSAEYYIAQAAAMHGVQIGKDIILKDTPLSTQMHLPSALAAVVPWDPSVSRLVEGEQKGREIDTAYPYVFTVGYLVVRKELIDAAPDVVQAISDAYQEAGLWLRLHAKQAFSMLAGESLPRDYSGALFVEQIEAYNNFFKPTQTYPFASFWSKVNVRISEWLYAQGRVRKQVSDTAFEGYIDRRFIDETYRRLGWKVPDWPPFLPRSWKGKITDLPYPAYLTVDSLQRPQAWPERGDLTRAWNFDGRTYRP